MTRREERESLFALLFEMSFSEKTAAEDVLEIEKQEREFSASYIVDGYHGVLAHLDEIDAMISENATGWKIGRLSKVTLAILRLGIYEMVYGSIPFSVAINEEVELAKKYDYEKAPAFINGILNKIAEQQGLKKGKGEKNPV